MTSDDFDKKRLQDLADHILQDQEQLKEYEDLLREETDPRLRKKYIRNIEQLKQSIARYKREYDELKERINRLERIFGNQLNSITRNQSFQQHPPVLFELLLKIDFNKQFRLFKTAIDKHLYSD